MTRRIGVVVNPVAGLGGPAGLKGSDGAATQTLALARGSAPRALERAVRMLRVLSSAAASPDVVTISGVMGWDAVTAAGLSAHVVWSPAFQPTGGGDTTAAVAALVAAGATLVLFVGGDGTARDVSAGITGDVPILGVPAGVKMYSSCFAVSPEAAGSVAARWMTRSTPTTTAEILDVDEEDVRAGHVRPRLHAIVSIPEVIGRTQARKTATADSERSAVVSAAAGVVPRLESGVRYLMGPGSTVAEVGQQLGLRLTPLGVDVVLNGRIVVQDASEAEVFAHASAGPTRAVITVIGGQGFLLGRGNQQLSPRVLRALADDPLLVVATERKLIGLGGRPLLVDTGDRNLDRALEGYVRVSTGPGTTAMYPVVAADGE